MAILDKGSFQTIALKIPISSDSPLESIVIELMADDVQIEGALYITDVILQGGTVATSHTPNPAEIRWSFDNV